MRLEQLTASLIERHHVGFDGSGYRRWIDLIDATPHGINLARETDRVEMVRFLNRWGCRIKKRVADCPSEAEVALEAWWIESPAIRDLAAVPLDQLGDQQLDSIASLYADLRGRPAGDRRTMAPTASSKVLMALAPSTVPAWDATIARLQYGGTTAECFRLHLATCRAWAQQVIDDPVVVSLLDPARRIGIAKLIDQALYGELVRKRR